MSDLNRKGLVGAVRQKALRWPEFVAMERHGKRQDVSGQQRRVRDAGPVCFGGLELKEQRLAHMQGVAQQGQTAALHIICQFPTSLMSSDDGGQFEMVMHARRFVDRFHGGRAVFAARLDCDEVGRHTVDVFAMPVYERIYKDGRTALRSSVSKFSKQEAKRRFGRDDKRSQGSALQDAWFEYLRDEVGLGVLRPERKKITARDRLEPEAYALRQDHQRVLRDAATAAKLLKRADYLAARAGRKLSRAAYQLQREVFSFLDERER